jgi:hypothetical protein
MKKQLFAVAILGLLMTAVSAYAQTIRMKADVPFNFIVDRATLPAGAYTIESAGVADALLIRDADGQAKRVVMPNHCESNQPAGQTKLVFRKYGDRYFLSQVWIEGNTLGHEFPKSSRETEVARDFTAQEVVLVASLR